jgi:Protein of unknown function, DUF547
MSHTIAKTRKLLIDKFLMLFIITLSTNVFADSRSYWDKSNENSNKQISHDQWQSLLDSYVVVASDKTAINLFNYKAVSPEDKITLSQYLTSLQSINPLDYNKHQQKAYWINLYNALTVKLVLDNYPASSILWLGDTFFAIGPWDDELATINNIKISLNDIEQTILRPIWKDPRIHYAINCASYGCPNLPAQAFTATNTEQQLNTAAITFINHPRAVTVSGKDLILSEIYSWYDEDFGNNEDDLIEHLKLFAKPELKQALIKFQQEPEDIDYDYQWQLNQLL